MSPTSSWNEVGKWLPNFLLLLNPKEHGRHQTGHCTGRARRDLEDISNPTLSVKVGLNKIQPWGKVGYLKMPKLLIFKR